jgi:hypothetical protein
VDGAGPGSSVVMCFGFSGVEPFVYATRKLISKKLVKAYCFLILKVKVKKLSP